MSTHGELACVYASLVLHDDGIAVTAEKISTLVKAANVNVDSYWPGLFAKLIEKRNIDDLISNVASSGSVAAPVAVTSAAGPGPGPAAVEEEKKKEEIVEESDEEIGFDIFADD